MGDDATEVVATIRATTRAAIDDALIALRADGVTGDLTVDIIRSWGRGATPALEARILRAVEQIADDVHGDDAELVRVMLYALIAGGFTGSLATMSREEAIRVIIGVLVSLVIKREVGQRDA